MISLNQNSIEARAAAWFDVEMKKLEAEFNRTRAAMMTNDGGHRKAKALSKKYNLMVTGKAKVPRC